MAPVASSGVGAAGREGQRIEEGRDQAELLIGIGGIRVADHVEVGIEAIDRLGQHRVAEAIDRVRELGHDRRVDVDVVDLGRREEQVDRSAERCARTPRTPGAGTASRCRTSRPGTAARRSTRRRRSPIGRDRRRPGVEQPFVQERDVARCQQAHGVLGLLDQPVVLGVEDGVDGGQADVLVHAAVAGDVVRVEQLVVVGSRLPAVADDRCRRRRRQRRRRCRQSSTRHGVMRDVVEEGVTGAHGVGRAVDRSRRIAFDQDVVAGAGNAVGARFDRPPARSRSAPGMKLP